MSDYYPPSETAGGWRKNEDPQFIRSLGMAPDKLKEFGRYNLHDVPEESGYASCIVIKSGWVIGEWYSKPEAETYCQYISSNGKAYAILLFGMIMEDSKNGKIPYKIDQNSKVYDKQWLPEGFPLSDPRKSEITFEHIFSHSSGILPESVEDPGRRKSNVNFTMYNIARDQKSKKVAKLFYNPGHPEEFDKDPYSSVAFNHIGLVIPRLIGKKASDFLWERLMAPIGFSKVVWYTPYWNAAESGIKWHSSTSPKIIPRDYARIAYLLLRDGKWGDSQLVPSSWIQKFRTSADYANIKSNIDGSFGSQYARDLFMIGGSGMNWAFIIPSLDLIAIRTSRSYASWDEHIPVFLRNLLGE